MIKNKSLVLITNNTLKVKLEKGCKESRITFLFPIENFCVGIPTTFKIKDLKEEYFIFVNRILDHEGIIAFKKMLESLPKNIKGIVFDDIGILNILLEASSKLTKILFLNHMNCNYKSINCFLEYVDSVVISTDITAKETKEILKKAQKPLVLYAFGYINIMYSRRTLLTNYNKEFNTSLKKETTLKESLSKKNVKAFENNYGTVIYTNEPFNNLALRNEPNILYNLINTVFMSDEEIMEIINDYDNNFTNKYSYKYLSEEETIFRIKDERI